MTSEQTESGKQYLSDKTKCALFEPGLNPAREGENLVSIALHTTEY
jgi:hypothetical protein